ncbi:MAG: NADPH:quinone oxidoreductase [uncultured Thiotrichaceae bacterium]|uniref:NADPH:quinone oxidoreductase n=1 Tax=uncultured Thiotrichaceae bacterium TaxID=298394 RepID=A0A6S6TVQ2_9GAMM|nr:MAG: NADPH:quinone oxidoreductase [uncultured Thiotrichaceae bacterium]
MKNDAKPELPTHMKAAIYKHYGSPDKISIEQVPVPTVTPADVLIRVHASTVNRTDCGFLRGKPYIVRLFSGLLKPKSTILGCEFAGEVVDAGSKAHDYNIGDRVFGFKDDDFGFGGHAEYTTMSTTGMLTHIPSHLSFAQAAPALEGAHYALHYIRAANIAAKHSVLINGASGAIGSAALQIIKHAGAHVTAVCSTANIEQMKALGADVVIDYQKQDFTQLDQRFDVVFDSVGKSTFGQCKGIMKPRGVYMSTELGPYWQNPFLALLSRFYGTQRVLFPMPDTVAADATFLRKLIEAGAYQPLVDRVYPLDDIVSAYEFVETGMKVGNVVIKLSHS